MIGLRPGGSFRMQLVVLTSAVTGIGVVVLIIVVQLALARSATGTIDTVLSDRADAVIGSATTGAHGDLRVPEAQLDAGVAVYDEQGDLAAGAAPRSMREIYSDLSTTDRSRSVEVGDETRVLGRPFRLADGTRGVVVVTESARPYEHAERQALWLSLGAGMLMVLLAAGLSAWVSRRALRPVVEMSRSADDWSRHDLTHRFDLGPGTNELTELGQTLDRLLDRVADAIRAEQRLTSELAHELRTPLASVQANAELALAGTDAGPVSRESLEEVLAASRRMSATIDGLLELARAEFPMALGGSCRLADALADAVAWSHGPGTVSYDVDESLRLALDDALAVRAIGPVVDNATRHGSHVEITAAAADGWIDITVDDDGPGVGADDREACFLPGRTSTGGAGLGLPLARRVARSAGGDVTFADRASGARVVVRLPRR